MPRRATDAAAYAGSAQGLREIFAAGWNGPSHVWPRLSTPRNTASTVAKTTRSVRRDQARRGSIGRTNAREIICPVLKGKEPRARYASGVFSRPLAASY